MEGPDDYGPVSDRYLGHEFNIGADWKIAHNLIASLRLARWKPGAWFDEAHQGLGFVYPGQPAVPYPLENRPAIYGLGASVAMEF